MPAEIHWEGNSRDVLIGFPLDVKKTFGYNLRGCRMAYFQSVTAAHCPRSVGAYMS